MARRAGNLMKGSESMNQSPDRSPVEGDIVALSGNKPNDFICHLLLAIIYPMIMYVCQFAVMFAAIQIGADLYSSDILVLADLLIIALLLAIILCSGKKIGRSLAMNKVAPSRIVMGFIAGIGLTCALNYLMNWVYSLFPTVMEDYSQHMNDTTEGSPFAYILAGVILAPLVEELLFRSLSLRHFDSVLPRGLSIILVATIFGLMHSNLIQGLYAGSLGILLCCLYFAYRSVWVPIAVHLGFNIVSIVAVIDTSGMSEAAYERFATGYGLFCLLAVFIGLTALVFLFIERTHPIWFKKDRSHRKTNVEVSDNQ